MPKFVIDGMFNGDSVLTFIEAETEEAALAEAFSNNPEWEDENGFSKDIETFQVSHMQIRIHDEEEE